MINDTHSSQGGPPEEGQDKKRIALVIAVVVSTVFIGGAWLLFLPYQMKQISTSDADETARWQEVRENLDNETAEFRASLEALRNDLDELEADETVLQEGSKTEGLESGRVPPEVIERLRNKLSELEAEDSGEDASFESAASNTDSETQSEESHASQEETE